MDDNKHPNQPQSSKESQKGSKAPGNRDATVVPSRRIFAKRWLYPAIYLGAAALIIGLMYIRSQSGTSPVTATNVDGSAGQTAATTETFQWPVADGVSPQVSLGFFPVSGPLDKQAATLVSYEGGYYPHKGYDIKAADGKAFSVTAAVSGKVTNVVTNNQRDGKTIEITGNGYTLEYQSLGDVKVQKGDMVSKGQVIGTSGTCAFEQSQGNHLYFEVDQKGKPVDPATLLPKQ
jgi:stage II sporulation protein Q